MSNQDNILKNKLRKGDLDSFKTLFELYYNQLIGYSNSITHDHEVSRELVQDVFLKLWENRGTNEIRISVKAYLFTAINHQALNWLRHEKVKRAYENDTLKDVFSGIQLPANVNPFLTEALRKSIESLPEKALEVFTMAQLDGMPQKEIAHKLGLSIKTIENQLARARKILQKRLRNYR